MTMKQKAMRFAVVSDEKGQTVDALLYVIIFVGPTGVEVTTRIKHGCRNRTAHFAALSRRLRTFLPSQPSAAATPPPPPPPPPTTTQLQEENNNHNTINKHTGN